MSERASKQASKQARTHASKQASKHASTRAGGQAGRAVTEDKGKQVKLRQTARHSSQDHIEGQFGHIAENSAVSGIKESSGGHRLKTSNISLFETNHLFVGPMEDKLNKIISSSRSFFMQKLSALTVTQLQLRCLRM